MIEFRTTVPEDLRRAEKKGGLAFKGRKNGENHLRVVWCLFLLLAYFGSLFFSISHTQFVTKGFVDVVVVVVVVIVVVVVVVIFVVAVLLVLVQ